MRPPASIFLSLTLACVLGAGLSAQDAPKVWSERETRLANEYLALLVQQPEYGRVVDLLWTLYEKHDSTGLLVENVSQQAAAQRHPSVMLVHGHLLRRAGDVKAAAALYDEVLKREGANVFALRSRADVAVELKQPDTAMALLKRLAEAQKETAAPVWLEIGNLALGSGNNAEAATAWETAARLQPADFTLARQVAQLLLQAGFPERAAAFFSKLADQKDPQRKLDALYDLARIYEHADQFPKADKALRDGLALLHFRDGRYLDFFRRRVRLHERFGALDELKKELEAAAKADPPSEQAVIDAARFFEITVELDEHVKWLRAIVKAVPQVDDYRWQLVRALLDHEGAAEAAKLLDERLKNDGSDLPALVLLRCEADLRGADTEGAVKRLTRLLEAQNSIEVEKQVLMFAQTRALDAVIERILRARVARDPQKAEAVFELAAFYRAHRDVVAEDRLLRAFTTSAGTEEERQKRLADASAFLAGSNNLDSAIILAREAVGKPGAGRAAWLHLADLLAEQGDHDEAAEWLEKAWAASTTDEERIDADERLFSILMGGKEARTKDQGVAVEFKLPDAFTGAGFGQNKPDEPGRQPLPEAVARHAEALLASAAQSSTDADRVRALWWALKTDRVDDAYAMLQALQFDTAGRARALSPVVETLKLDLAVADENLALQERQLRRLMEMDPAGRVRHTLRLSELLLETERRASAEVAGSGWRTLAATPVPGTQAARLLEQAFREQPESEQLLSALTQVYLLQRRVEEVLALWTQAVKRAEGTTATLLMERHADLLLRLHRLEEHVQVQARLMERETDVKRRRETLRRCVDRLTFSDANGGELAPSVLRDRLQMVERALRELVQRHPFDGFYHEALAQVYERQGDHAKAFASMKQAYYTAPETPFSLDQLREAAMKTGDLKSAIYFQKQIAAGAPPAELAVESRRLVELLEQTFQIDEADRVRRRLESRFAQDVTALDELAKYYQASGQDEAERRVYEQVVKVRPWDARAQLRLALKFLRFADTEAAERHLLRILDTSVKGGSITRGGARAPLPLSDVRKPHSKTPTSDITPLLDFAPGLERPELDKLRAFLGLPRPEFSEVPEDAALVRLRAVEELSKVRARRGGAALEAWRRQWSGAGVNEIERLWALYYSGVGESFRKHLRALVEPEADTLEGQFTLLWLTLRSHGMQDALAWAVPPGPLAPEKLAARERLLHACVAMLVDAEGFRFQTAELSLLGASRALRNTALLDVTDKLKDKQRYAEALALGEGLPRHARGLATDYSLFLARIAESAEDWKLARHYLGQAVKGPVAAGGYRGTYDPFLLSVTYLSRVAPSAQEREELLRGTWRRLQRAPGGDLTAIRRAAVTGLAGAEKPAAEKLERFLSGDFTSTRQVSDSRGSLIPQGSSRYEEAQHLRSVWEETREIQALLRQQGLGGVVQAANERLDRRWGTTMLSPRSDSEFGEWRINELLSRLRAADHPTRLRLIREHLASVDLRTEHSVDTIGNLGSRLETAGMTREAVSLYRVLPPRAPSNPDYAQWLLRACENSWDIEPGCSFALQILTAEAPLKPPAVGDEFLRDKHAMFLARNFDLDELRARGFREKISETLPGRTPHEAAYLREFGLLQERMGNDQAALLAWEHLKAVFAHNDQSGGELDAEGHLHRGKLLQKLARPQEALAALKEIPVNDPPGTFVVEALELRARLAAALDNWNEIRDLKVLAVEKKLLPVVVAVARVLAEHDKVIEALNFLTQAERTLRDDHQRFVLRLEQMQLLARDTAWTPERDRARVAALFRSPTRDKDALAALLDWLKQQARTPAAAGWQRVLRTEALAGGDRCAAALALCAFASSLPDTALADLLQAWAGAGQDDRLCIELAAQRLLDQARPAWAREACQAVAAIPTLREQGRKLPLAVRVAHALNDEAEIRELFNETLRMPFPGGVQTAEWARAFEDTGHTGLARELFDAALRQLDNTEGLQPELYAAWTRFLIRQRDFDAAETFLMRMNWTMPVEAPKLVFELHEAWGKLDGIESELPKFHLPTGVVKEILFLVRQRAEKSAPRP
jgi:tetratricopeptide (TPR) repeat protein